MDANAPDKKRAPARARRADAFPEVMTARQAADYLQLNTQVLYRYIREGLIPVARVGKTVRLKKSVIDRWLEASSWESIRHEGRIPPRNGK